MLFRSRITKKEKSELKTFVTFSEREKTISTTKRSYSKDLPLEETPEGCYKHFLKNYHLLFEMCKIKMPTFKKYDIKSPPFICYLSPHIGPLYMDISKKISKGSITKGSEIRIEISDIHIENISLDGSLLIESKIINKNKYLHPKCFLKNVKIKNLGIDKSHNNIYWQNKIKRKQSLEIILKDNAFFYAENVIFNGTVKIIVPANTKMTAYQQNNVIKYKIKNI